MTNNITFRTPIHLAIGSVITEDSIMSTIMEDDVERHKFMNMWAKFMLNDFKGILKKKGKELSEAPHPCVFRKWLLALHYGKITRSELREYVAELV